MVGKEEKEVTKILKPLINASLQKHRKEQAERYLTSHPLKEKINKKTTQTPQYIVFFFFFTNIFSALLQLLHNFFDVVYI